MRSVEVERRSADVFGGGSAALGIAFFRILITALFAAVLVEAQTVTPLHDQRIQVAAYYFPNWHEETQPAVSHGEWEALKNAKPRFPGQPQPRVPLWGYQDEADPEVMAQKIDAAADHGVDAFLFDWYWHNGREGKARCSNGR